MPIDRAQNYGITKAAFSDWLLAKNPYRSVGISNQSTTCPLTQFIKSLGYLKVSVDHDDIIFRVKRGDHYRVAAQTKWMKCFVRHADGTDGIRKSVKAHEALRYLKKRKIRDLH